MYIITDGDDNSSKKYNKENSEELCQHARQSGLWNIIHFHTDDVLVYLNNTTANILYKREDDLSDIFENLSI